MSSLQYDSFLVYFLIAAVQGIILSSLIIFQRPRTNPSIYLGLLIFLFSLSILHGVLEDSIHAFNGRFPIPMNYAMLYGPLAFFHIQSLIKPKFRFTRQQLIQFIPSLLFDVICYVSIFSYAAANMDWAYENIILIRSIAFGAGILSFIHILIYTFLIYKTLRNADFDTDNQLNTLKRWVRNFMFFWLFGLITMAILVPIVYQSMSREDYGYNLFFPIGIVDSLIVYFLGYSYLMKFRAIVQQRLNRANRMKYSPEEIKIRKGEIVEAFTLKKLFKDSSLNVNKLAEELGWTAKDVSWMMSEVFETNFNDWVNKYRVDAFTELMKQPDSNKYSIEGLAREVGFNSKASFYRAFKKWEGKTPKEYMESIH